MRDIVILKQCLYDLFIFGLRFITLPFSNGLFLNFFDPLIQTIFPLIFLFYTLIFNDLPRYQLALLAFKSILLKELNILFESLTLDLQVFALLHYPLFFLLLQDGLPLKPRQLLSQLIDPWI